MSYALQDSLIFFEDLGLQFISYQELDNFLISLWESYERFIEEMSEPHALPSVESFLDNEIIRHETYSFPSEVLNHLEDGFLWREFYTNPELTDDPGSDEWYEKDYDTMYRQVMVENWEAVFEEFVQELMKIFDAYQVSYERRWIEKHRNIPVVEVW